MSNLSYLPVFLPLLSPYLLAALPHFSLSAFFQICPLFSRVAAQITMPSEVLATSAAPCCPVCFSATCEWINVPRPPVLLNPPPLNQHLFPLPPTLFNEICLVLCLLLCVCILARSKSHNFIPTSHVERWRGFCVQ